MASIQLEGFRVTSLHIDTADGNSPEAVESSGMNLSWSVANHPEDPLSYQLIFGLEAHPEIADEEDTEETLPKVKLVMEGRFAFDPGVPEEKRKEVVLITGSSILYGLARGLLAGVSGAFRNSVILPTVDMAALVMAMLEEEKTATSTKQTPSKRKTTKASKPASTPTLKKKAKP